MHMDCIEMIMRRFIINWRKQQEGLNMQRPSSPFKGDEMVERHLNQSRISMQERISGRLN